MVVSVVTATPLNSTSFFDILNLFFSQVLAIRAPPRQHTFVILEALSLSLSLFVVVVYGWWSSIDSSRLRYLMKCATIPSRGSQALESLCKTEWDSLLRGRTDT